MARQGTNIHDQINCMMDRTKLAALLLKDQ
uniref:Uncharacterized protein n=1 Tax=Arundo donax TaxID=35708 RepID=A0A0A9GDR3_ARUDO